VSFASLIEVIAQVLILVGVGVALRASRLLEPSDAKPLNTIIIYVGLPALVFGAISDATFDATLARVVAVAWVVILAGVGVAWFASSLLGLSGPTRGGFIICAALGNTGYLGYPLALALLGDEGLVRAIVYDLFGTVLIVLTVGLALAQHFGDDGGKRTNLLKEVVTFPGVIALALAVLLRPVALPDLVSRSLDSLGSLTVPLIMIAVGVSLEPRAIRPHLRSLGGVAVIKLLVVPLAALALGSLVFSSSAEHLRLVVMQAGMPTMMLSLVFGIRYKLDVDFIASAILVTTVGALVTVPLFQLLIA
jgi:auxin efflux carrier (AEC)